MKKLHIEDFSKSIQKMIVNELKRRILMDKNDLKKSLKSDFDDFLLWSYLYYHLDISLVPDCIYDKLCYSLANHWEDLEHPYKSLACLADMECGSGFAIPKDSYPDYIVTEATRIAEEG